MVSKIAGYARQPDAVTCQSAAIAKKLGLSSPADIQDVRYSLTQMGQAGDPLVMGRYLAPKVQEYHWIPDGSLAELRDWVSRGTGYEAIIHGMTTGSGHVWGVSDYADGGLGGGRFLCDDPWAEFNFPEHTYTNHTGDDVVYSALGIYAYCVVAWTENQAIQAYRAGVVDWDRRGMYLHLVRN